MKKYAEQQARHRDVPTAMPSQMQQIPPSRFALAPGSGYNYPVNAMNPNISNGPLNVRAFNLLMFLLTPNLGHCNNLPLKLLP